MDRHDIYRFDDFQVDSRTWRLSRNGREIHLEPTVLKLLVYLISHRDRLVTRGELMDTVWGETVISDSALSKAVARLRKALGDNAVAPRYIETVHSQGYRFIAAVEEGPSGSAEEVSGNARRAKVSRGLSAIAVVALLGLLFWFWPDTPDPTSSKGDGIMTLAVLPLSNLTGQPDRDFFVDGMQDSLITVLSRKHGLRVISRQSTLRYRNSELSLPEIAGELGVDLLVEGSVLSVGERVEINLQLIDAHNDDHLWAQRYEREAPYIFDLLAEAAASMGSELGLQADPEPLGPVDPQAIEAYWLGLKHLNRLYPASLNSAIQQFKHATALEPEFSLAWGHLAAAHAMLAVIGAAPPRESIELARTAALRAIEAGNRPAIGYASLGWVRLWTGEFEDGCEAFRQALQINPSEPYAIHGEADCLMLEGRMDESLERLRELTLLAPFTFFHQLPLSFHLFVARRYDEALSVTLGIRDRFPRSPVHVNLSLIYWQLGEYEKALIEERLKFELYGDTALVEVLDRHGDQAAPREVMRALGEAMAERAKHQYVDPFEIGETFAHAGMTDQALYWLNKAVDNGSYEVIYIGLRPDFDALRAEPGFVELLTRAGLNSD